MKGFRLIIFILLSFGLIGYFAFRYFNQPSPPVRPSPEKRQSVNYSSYVIIDQATGKTLMVIFHQPVEAGDELITDTNRRYVVVRVRGNKAYAKYLETVKIQTTPY